MSKELGSQPGFTPKAGAFREAAAFVRELVKQGLMDREKALRITDEAYRQTMVAQALGIDDGYTEELPEHSKIFPGATDKDGNIIFSNNSK